MRVVDAACSGRLALQVEHVAEVVQQGRRDQRIVGAVGFRKCCSLQCMRELRHWLTSVAKVAMFVEDSFDVPNGECHQLRFPARVAAAASAAAATLAAVARVSLPCRRLGRSFPACSRIG